MPTLQTQEFDNLLAGDQAQLVTRSETVASGAGVLVKGTVLGRITASKKLKTVNSANADGSQTAYAVLAADVDATSSDKTAVVYLAGAFDKNQLIFGGTDTVETHRDTLRDLGIFAVNAVAK